MSSEVLRTGVVTRWIPLDVSNDVRVDIWLIQALAVQGRGASGEATLDFLNADVSFSHGGQYFWDPVAAVAMSAPAIVTTRLGRGWSASPAPMSQDRGRRGRQAGADRDRGKRCRVHHRDAAVLRPARGSTAELPAGPANRAGHQRRAAASISTDRQPCGRQNHIGLQAPSGGGYEVVARLTGRHTRADVQ
jgi:hypothetical protein